MNKKLTKLTINDYKQLVNLAIAEDIGSGDITSQSANLPNEIIKAYICAREPGILAGMPVVAYTLKKISPKASLKILKKDGSPLQKGTRIAQITGPTIEILTAERILLNFLQRLSGIASTTQQYVQAVRQYNAQILDTRKTTPGYRKLEKYAVTCGGGYNHRMGLYDMVLIKDNHIASLSQTTTTPVAEAIQRARKKIPKTIKIIVEVDTLEQLVEALPQKPDIVLLDNMSAQLIKRAVNLRDKAHSKTLLEVSGGVTLATVQKFAATGVDRISIGALTHSVKALDIGLDIL